ncbi:MAG: Ldh family oxidoreductase, partial [Caldilineaceae bacterium]|nr:Ldh family oxidoreductase [Caldilineaceae bacterium]
MPTVSHERLRDFGAAIFRAAGVPDDQADVAIGHLVESNLMGHDSHGVLHLAGYTRSLVSGAIRPVGDHKIMRETPVSCVIDADRAFGIVLTYQAMQMGIEKAQANTL